MEAADTPTQNLSAGPSPGGAASELGVTRQAIHKLIRTGDLEAMGVYEGRKLLFYVVDPTSLAAYKERRKERLLSQLTKLVQTG